MRSHTLTKNDWRGLWAVLWRFLLFGPILLPIGFVILVVAMAATVAPFAYAAVLMTSGHFLLGMLLAFLWSAALWLARPVFDWLFEGLEYATS